MLSIPLENLCDPLTNKLLINPVIASNGITYDRDALMKLYKGEDDPITLPDGEKIENKFFEDRVTKEKVKKFLKENPDFIMPISEESRKKFISAVACDDLKEMELSVNEEPLLLSEKLFEEKTVFQYLAQEGASDNMDKLCFLLKIAKTKRSASEWYGFFENHIASNGKASVIVRVVQHHLRVLDINDNGFSGQNTLLHLAAKYVHKKLVKRLIIKCKADTYLMNEDNNKAKKVAPPRSGIPQLIEESIQKKVFKQLFEPREKELNKKIKSLEDQNAALKDKLDKAESLKENLRIELNKAKKYAENLEVKLNGAEKSIAALKIEQTKIDDRVGKIQVAHNNFVRSAREKAFFRLPRIQSTFQVKRKVEQCSYDPDDFDGKKDTYATLMNSSDAPRYRMACCLFYETLFTSDLPSKKEEEDYNKCLLL